MTRRYQPFVIHVGEQTGGLYPVRAEFQGASWAGAIPANLPLLSRGEIRQALHWLERGFVDREYAQDFGRRLFQTLFAGPVREGLRAAYERVAPADGLRLVLTLPPALASLPWELMYDDEGGHGFLARSNTVPLVRHLDGMPLPHVLPQEGPLRVLIVAASPVGHAPISGKREIEEVAGRLAGRRLGLGDRLRLVARHLLRGRSLRGLGQRLRRRGLVEIDVLPHATRQALQQRMIQARAAGEGYHAVHFIGHGEASDVAEGQLLLETESGGPDPVPATEFAELIAEPTVCLAVLNACETAGSTSLFHGVAQATVQRRVPAVIGMQVPILDEAAVGFARELYGAWAAGEPIEAALAYARRLVNRETPGAAADWSIPVLYMGPVEGLSLNLHTERPKPPKAARALRWVVVTLLSLISTSALLLEVPGIARTVRTEVPVIRCVYPYPMDQDAQFRVAVAEFVVVDEGGRQVRSRDGLALARYLALELSRNLDELEIGLSHDVRPPDQSCPIRGSSREEREQAAAEVAKRIGAHLVIYGAIAQAGDQSQFSPEFYVNYRGFEEGEDIVGQHELGRALRVALPFDAGSFSPAENPALSARANALSLITIGLAYYAADDFEMAATYFSQAEATRGWLDTAGKEVAYLLLGNTAVRRASKEKSAAYLDQAERDYQRALAIDEEYARALVGQAQVLYLLALKDATDETYERIDTDLLDRAASGFQAALGLGQLPASANIEAKVHLGLGQVYYARLVRALATGGDWERDMGQARAELEAVIAEYQGGNESIANLAGHAHARLGLLARQQRRTVDAIDHYREAVELCSPFYKAFYTTSLGQVYADAGEFDLAVESYEEAIRIGESNGDGDSVRTYSAALEKLKETGP